MGSNPVESLEFFRFMRQLLKIVQQVRGSYLHLISVLLSYLDQTLTLLCISTISFRDLYTLGIPTITNLPDRVWSIMKCLHLLCTLEETDYTRKMSITSSFQWNKVCCLILIILSLIERGILLYQQSGRFKSSSNLSYIKLVLSSLKFYAFWLQQSVKY